MKIALVQTNPTIGDLEGNTARVLDGLTRAADAGAQLAVFPEQTLIGYPAKDLLLRQEIIQGNLAALKQIAAAATDVAALVGFAEPNWQPAGRPLFNSAALLHRGETLACIRKRLLPIYDVFDEVRYFESAGPQATCAFGGIRLGVTICEDMWSHEEMMGHPLYACDPIGELAAQGADVFINVSASPSFIGKYDLRINLLRRHAQKTQRPILFVNQVGGNDEQLFDGASVVLDGRGKIVGRARAFDEDMLLVDLDALSETRCESYPSGTANLYRALVMGLRDYVRKCGFQQVVIGLSGGIDSAVVAALAAAALGPENVHAVALPSRYSSQHSLDDAKALAANLDIRFSVIEIEPLHATFEQHLKPHFDGRPPDITEENIQARSRGVVLMALANKFGSLLLTTGNKSELAVGYCTLYGDMAGGLAVISDVPKTMVYELARHMNGTAGREVIPENILTKPPSAELKPDQMDQDSLPPYDVLDEILERYEVRLESPEQIVAAGFDADIVNDVVRKIRGCEHKRQQAALGLKVTSRAFGFGRRMPIAAQYPR